MKKWDYEITIAGLKRMITPRSDRAKQRTPEPQEFASNDEALVFVRAGVAEGFLFANRGFIDREYRNVRYHYLSTLMANSYPADRTMDLLIRCSKSGMFIPVDREMERIWTSPLLSSVRWQELMGVAWW